MRQTQSPKLDHWISAYPKMRQYILNNAHFFTKVEPPSGKEVPDQEWIAMIDSLMRE